MHNKIRKNNNPKSNQVIIMTLTNPLTTFSLSLVMCLWWLGRWVSSQWSSCSVSCGEGQQYRTVHCWRMMAPGFDSTVHDFLCSSLMKPVLSRSCKEADCGPLWETSEWGEVRTQPPISPGNLSPIIIQLHHPNHPVQSKVCIEGSPGLGTSMNRAYRSFWPGDVK